MVSRKKIVGEDTEQSVTLAKTGKQIWSGGKTCLTTPATAQIYLKGH